MRIDLTHTFKDSRRLLNSWKARYTLAEYPYKVVLNIFYSKYTIEKMWPQVINNRYSDWHTAYKELTEKFGEVSKYEIVPVLENWAHSNRKVTVIKFSDFKTFIDSGAKGDINSLKGIEYTYCLNRLLDEMVLIWLSMVIAGMGKIEAVAQITGAVIADMPINSHAEIEQIIYQLGVENYLQNLFVREMSGQL